MPANGLRGRRHGFELPRLRVACGGASFSLPPQSRQGLTHSEIAATLSASERTVRRRLSIALAHLEEYARRSGAWIASIATTLLLLVVEQGTRLGRIASHVRPEWPAGIAVGALGVA